MEMVVLLVYSLHGNNYTSLAIRHRDDYDNFPSSLSRESNSEDEAAAELDEPRGLEGREGRAAGEAAASIAKP
ncbi:hypothetical protein F2P81_012976 [Scophthalmus maximus]|uniref:Uncharacterized protein n=1 Tax=Scophthalmus maximus TaxID=52904 RepID=A0A6A4SST4_SCOMX|nr:hypothetical protein F2P81_012976 [Scophthalmus maximus]